MKCTVAGGGLNIPAILSLLVVACGRVPTAQVTGQQSGVLPPPGPSIAITNVTIIDVATGAEEAAVTVLTKAGQIANVGRGISIPREAVRVDGTGKALIPGLRQARRPGAAGS
jgi:hypothetical protein